MTNISGLVANGWEDVRSAFAHNLAETEEVGAGVAVYHRGRKVVDLTGGSFDESRTRPYDESTLQLVFSTTKGIVAIAVGMCIERGLLRYDDPVAEHWPEFAEHGKGGATVAQLLSHQCGLIAPDGPITLAETLDWDTVTARMAATQPDWEIGTGHGYHAVSYGFLAGELIRRVDPEHRTPGRFVAEEIVGPLGVEMWIGLPEEHEPRVAPILGHPVNDKSDDPFIAEMLQKFLGPDTRGGRALMFAGALAGEGTFNRRDVHAAEIPAANGIANAGSLARIYAATLGPIDGIQLLHDAVRNVARTCVTPEGEGDLCLIMPTTFGMGFMTSGPFSLFAGPGSYGHPGAGGSVAFAQPERELAFAYVMNRSARNLAGDLRAQRLIDAAAAIIDRGI
jgi:CubicO group peptidase (beta-lactamase class C family)